MHDDMDVVVADDVADLYQPTTLGRANKHDQTLTIWAMSNNRVAIGVKDVLLIQVMPVSTRSDNRLMPHALQVTLQHHRPQVNLRPKTSVFPRPVGGTAGRANATGRHGFSGVPQVVGACAVSGVPPSPTRRRPLPISRTPRQPVSARPGDRTSGADIVSFAPGRAGRLSTPLIERIPV